MQQMAELVEERFDLVVRKKRGPAVHGLAHVARDYAEGGNAAVGGRKQVHPRARALRFAGVKVGVEQANEVAVFVADLVKLDARMPRSVFPARFFHFQAE